jgi:hypothetical protein
MREYTLYEKRKEGRKESERRAKPKRKENGL